MVVVMGKVDAEPVPVSSMSDAELIILLRKNCLALKKEETTKIAQPI